MSVPMQCPHCKADFRGEEIPTNWSCGGETNFSRVIGLHSYEADAPVAWKCPDCDYEWEITEELPLGLRTFELMDL